MKSIKKSWIIIGVLVLLLAWVLLTYNGFVRANLAVDTQWAQVETDYQRRFDLIPNLVSSVQGIFTQEKEVFTAIAEARKGYAGAKTVNEKVQATNQVESALGRLLVIAENYPQLQSSQSVQTLMTQLEGTENRISVQRNRFNQEVATFNGKLIVFPSNILGKIFGFTKRDFFQSAKGAEIAPSVKLN